MFFTSNLMYRVMNLNSLISKIEISRFRSISSTSIELDEINIFSGKNNSGKSNILKALNLFFNSESGSAEKFDFTRDYNRAFTGQARGRRVAKIKVHFNSQSNSTGALQYPFWIEKTFDGNDVEINYGSQNGQINEKLKSPNNGTTTRQFKIFLAKIRYFYIPAVRDKNFVARLLLEFKHLIESEKNSKDEFERARENLSEILGRKSQDISRDFEKFIKLPTSAALSSNITDLLGAIEINVRTGIQVQRRIKGGNQNDFIEVDLFSTGDGILMSYLAYFLAHICKKIPKKSFIWGFEEPENSLEYSKVEALAEKFFSDFKNCAQILITTHSPAFVNLREKKNVKFYRVYIEPKDTKQISQIITVEKLRVQLSLLEKNDLECEQYDMVSNELYLVEFSKKIQELALEAKHEKDQLIKERDELKNKGEDIAKIKPDKIFICEDGLLEVIELWKFLLKEMQIEDVCVLSSKGSTTKLVENGIKHVRNLDNEYNPKVFRQIDRDGLTEQQILLLSEKVFKNEKKNLRYEFKFLPVNELENFAVIEEKNFLEELWNLNKEKIIKNFDLTASAKCRAYCKEFEEHDEKKNKEKFIKSGETMKIVHGMRDEALLDWRRYFPGKDMISTDKAITYLKTIRKNQWSKDLKEFMIIIKDFFDSK